LETKELDHTKCRWSTGIHEGLTVGQGELDEYGFWKKPCPICARAFEVKHPEFGHIWPFPKEDPDKFK
jgi:hypothetical protein